MLEIALVPESMPQGSFVPFPSTAWTVIRRAQEAPSEQHGELLGELMARYRAPLYTFFRVSLRQPPEQADDLVQELLCCFLEPGRRRDKLLEVTPTKGHFRSWLCTCATNFLRDELRRRRLEYEELPDDICDNTDAEKEFNKTWRRTMLEQSLRDVHKICEEKDRLQHWAVFSDYYLPADDAKLTWQQVSERYHLPTWKDAAHRADWVKAQLAKQIRNHVRTTVDCEEDVTDELRELLFS